MIARLALFAAAVCGALFAQNAAFTARVIGISDGDTIKVLEDGVSKRIRFWGIDCPESTQAFGTKAKQFTAELAFGKTVSSSSRH
jgi:endonuclease YncB( thermonuclease family)